MNDGDFVNEARPGAEEKRAAGASGSRPLNARGVRRRKRKTLGAELAALPPLNSLSPATRRAIWENVKTIGLALLIALFLRTFLFQPFNIPSGSMKSTLLVGDYLFVSKYSYGYSRFSFPLGLAPIKGRIFASNPERGDIVVFKNPNDHRDFIKRVIGLPGDKVQMIRGTLYVNGEAVRLEYLDEYVDRDELGREERLFRYRETLPNGVSYMTLRACPAENSVGPGPVAAAAGGWGRMGQCHSPENNTPEYIVPEGKFFMMGDNRDNSADSRDFVSGVGYVPRENLVGKAQVLFLSTESSFWAIWDWRWGRFFKGIH